MANIDYLTGLYENIFGKLNEAEPESQDEREKRQKEEALDNAEQKYGNRPQMVYGNWTVKDRQDNDVALELRGNRFHEIERKEGEEQPTEEPEQPVEPQTQETQPKTGTGTLETRANFLKGKYGLTDEQTQAVFNTDPTQGKNYAEWLAKQVQTNGNDALKGMSYFLTQYEKKKDELGNINDYDSKTLRSAVQPKKEKKKLTPEEAEADKRKRQIGQWRARWTEAEIDDLQNKGKSVNGIEPKQPKNPEFVGLTDVDMEAIYNMDPTPKKIYGTWLGRQIQEYDRTDGDSGINPNDDAEMIKELLEKYGMAIEDPDFDDPERNFFRDIDQYKNDNEVVDYRILAEALNTFENRIVLAGQQTENYRKVKDKGARELIRGESHTWYEIRSDEAARVMGSGSNWCTTAGAAMSYLKTGTLYIAYDNATGKPDMQFYFNETGEGGHRSEFKGPNNNPAWYMDYRHLRMNNKATEGRLASARELGELLNFKVLEEGQEPNIKDILENPLALVEYIREKGAHGLEEQGVEWSKAEEIIAANAEAAVKFAISEKGARWPEAENTIIQNPKLAMKYMKHFFHGDRWPALEEQILTKEPDALMALEYAKKFLPRGWGAAGWEGHFEQVFLDQPEIGVEYVAEVLKKRWQPLENQIIKTKNARAAAQYAIDMEKLDYDVRWNRPSEYLAKKNSLSLGKHGRWLEAEPFIARNGNAAAQYAKEIMRQRWPEAEPTIFIAPRASARYVAEFIKFGDDGDITDPEFLDAAIQNLVDVKSASSFIEEIDNLIRSTRGNRIKERVVESIQSKIETADDAIHLSKITQTRVPDLEDKIADLDPTKILEYVRNIQDGISTFQRVIPRMPNIERGLNKNERAMVTYSIATNTPIHELQGVDEKYIRFAETSLLNNDSSEAMNYIAIHRNNISDNFLKKLVKTPKYLRQFTRVMGEQSPIVEEALLAPMPDDDSLDNLLAGALGDANDTDRRLDAIVEYVQNTEKGQWDEAEDFLLKHDKYMHHLTDYFTAIDGDSKKLIQHITKDMEPQKALDFMASLKSYSRRHNLSVSESEEHKDFVRRIDEIYNREFYPTLFDRDPKAGGAFMRQYIEDHHDRLPRSLEARMIQSASPAELYEYYEKLTMAVKNSYGETIFYGPFEDDPEWKEATHRLAESAYTATRYSYRTKKRFIEGERSVLENPKYSVDYYDLIVPTTVYTDTPDKRGIREIKTHSPLQFEDQWDSLEEKETLLQELQDSIASNGKTSLDFVIKRGRFKQGELAIAKDPESAFHFIGLIDQIEKYKTIDFINHPASATKQAIYSKQPLDDDAWESTEEKMAVRAMMERGIAQNTTKIMPKEERKEAQELLKNHIRRYIGGIYNINDMDDSMLLHVAAYRPDEVETEKRALYIHNAQRYVADRIVKIGDKDQIDRYLDIYLNKSFGETENMRRLKDMPEKLQQIYKQKVLDNQEEYEGYLGPSGILQWARGEIKESSANLAATLYESIWKDK